MDSRWRQFSAVRSWLASIGEKIKHFGIVIGDFLGVRAVRLVFLFYQRLINLKFKAIGGLTLMVVVKRNRGVMPRKVWAAICGETEKIQYHLAKMNSQANH
jgi:hypothetical protein